MANCLLLLIDMLANREYIYLMITLAMDAAQ
jgi:hypothetical protein